MTDSEFTMFVFLWIFGGIILFQWWRIHRYRNKIEQLAFDHAKVKPQPVQAIAPPADSRRDEELERIKKRLQVLERIATDDNNRLESEFEALRRA
jgi:hypothetical protein